MASEKLSKKIIQSRDKVQKSQQIPYQFTDKTQNSNNLICVTICP